MPDLAVAQAAGAPLAATEEMQEELPPVHPVAL